MLTRKNKKKLALFVVLFVVIVLVVVPSVLVATENDEAIDHHQEMEDVDDGSSLDQDSSIEGEQVLGEEEDVPPAVADESDVEEQTFSEEEFAQEDDEEMMDQTDDPLEEEVAIVGEDGEPEADGTVVPPVCDAVLDQWNAEEVKAVIAPFLVQIHATPELQETVMRQIQYGVQIRKVCGKCSDYEDVPGFCEPSSYGYDVTHSGLAILPLEEPASTENPKFLPGSHLVSVYCHGIKISAPSNDWESLQDSWFFIATTAMLGSVTIIPDYMGYGEALNKSYRSFIITRAYQTSTIPLVMRAQQMLEEESGGYASLKNEAVIAGYSEGGYAAVAISQAFRSMNYSILRTDAGAGPYNLAQTQVSRLFDPNLYDLPVFFEAFFASAYSSTYEGLANYGVQDALNEDYREVFVELTNSDAPPEAYVEVIPVNEHPTVMFTGQFRDFMELALAKEDPDPCVSSDPALVELRPELLCKALKDNDLTEALLSVDYPVYLCHAEDDTVVLFDNVPDITQNPDYLSLYVAKSHGHEMAYVECVLQAFTYMAMELPSILQQQRE